MAKLTREERDALRQRIDEARRAALGPARRDARPGHPSRFRNLGHVPTVINAGREIRRPTLQWYDDLPPAKPPILAHLNG